MAAQARQLMLQLLDPVIALFDLGLEDRYGLSHIHMSPDFLTLPTDDQVHALLQIQSYNFEHRYDLTGERRFGTVEINHVLVYWKVLYRSYDWSHRQEDTPDPADGRRTRRVLTLWTHRERAYHPERV